MTPAALLAFMLSLVGGRAPDGLVAYRDAIIATDASPEELRVLAVVAKHETYYHLTSRTPPFGLTDREQRGLPRLTIPASARVALAVLRYTRARCAAAGAPAKWSDAGAGPEELAGTPDQQRRAAGRSANERRAFNRNRP